MWWQRQTALPYLCEQDGEHVLPLEADGQMHQREAHIKGRGAVEELHLVCSELPGDVSARRLVGFYRCQVSLHHACSRGRKEGQKIGCRNGSVQLLFQEFVYTGY